MIDDEKLAANSKRLLDDSVEHIDAATLSRLHQARSTATASLKRRSFFAEWLPAGVVAGMALAVLAVTLSMPGSEPSMLPSAGDLELVTGLDALEMVEDIEFYEWLDANGNAG